MTQELLPLSPPATNALTVSAALTKSLVDKLLSASSPEDAAQELAHSTALLDEAKAHLEAVRRMAGPCGKDHVYIALQPALILYGPPDLGSGRAGDMATGTWIELYKNALWQLPKEALEEAISEYIANGDAGSSSHPASRVKFPTPAQINNLARPSAERLRKIAWRMRVAVETAHKYAPPRKRTPEEIAAIEEMRLATVAKLRGMGQKNAGTSRETPAQMADRIRSAGGAVTP